MRDEERKTLAGTKSVRMRHFTERINDKRRLLRFVCEARPLIVLTIHDVPKRCPVCAQNHPISTGQAKGETNDR